MAKATPKATGKKSVSLALITVYHNGDLSFPVLPEDAVRTSDDKVLGYNHSRAWRAARDA